MNVKDFQENRAHFSWEELRKYDGQWVAFSLDGRRIIASHADLAQLYELIAAKDSDPEKTAMERIEFNGESYGGGEAY